jgi:prepilin-type processing-associated H-X9-DG protein
LRSNSAFLKPISRVPNPANTVYFAENCGRFAYRTNYFEGSCSASCPDNSEDADKVIVGWHRRPWYFNTAFVDGHAATVKMEGHIHPQPRLSSYPGGGCCPADDGPEYENCYMCWRCVILRGPQWQLDTLPAAPVDTGVEWDGSSCTNSIS